MHAARGVLTARGGMTSHAAVVARGMGRVCVAGAGSVHIDYTTMVMTIDGHSIAEGEWITLDGSTGAVYLGRVATIPPILSDDFNTLMGWADATRRLGVRANAETPDDAKTARRFGAEGIGLARTEHMFFGPDRIGLVRQMIIADDEAVRQRAINALLTFQRDDFVSIFRIMAGLPVTVRLLDPPLHEFLPHAEGEIAEVATALGRTVEEIRARCASLAEANPMLGHRGCRLGLTNPEIYAMQVRALIEAALQVSDETGKGIVPEIMIPLVATKAELEVARRAAEAEIISVLQERGASLDYRIGTMIELPRAAIQAGEIAHHADFFSFGTNDLTQTTFGLSRDDAGSFLPFYVDHGLLPKDPFVSIDRDGVGGLVRMGVERGRATHPGLKLGICGEHGGDPDSIAFFEAVGLDYVSCSPFRVPVARLAAAQAALAHRKENAAA